ncbi:MAG: LTA synthase family protein [Clostridium sp.]|nr:LTA synthase family protein [Clostridium sp.]
MNRSNHMSPPDRSVTFFFAALACLALQWLAFLKLCPAPDYRPWTLFAAGFPETLILLLPYWLITPRLRPTIFIPLSLSALWLLANSLYFRNFGDVLSVDAFGMTDNLGRIVVDSAVNSFRPCDLLLFMPTVVLALIYPFCFGRRVTAPRTRFRRRTRVAALAATAFVAILWQGFLFFRDFRDGILPREHAGEFARTSRSGYIRSYGYLQFLLSDLRNSLKSPYRQLNDSELAEIARFTDRQRELLRDGTDSCRTAPPNLILIIVESLNSDALTSAAPNLRRLLADTAGVFRALNVKPQIGIGRSSDGQFIYNTGLLPTEDRVTAFTYVPADYPSLAKAFGHRAEEIIGEGASLWNHNATSLSFGYDALHDIRELPDYRKPVADSVIFDRAIAFVDTVRQPFMLEITTLSMHQPYLESDYTPGALRRALGNSEKTYYLESVNYFDRHLGRFLDHLRSTDLLDSCVVAIASDHNAPLRLTDSETADDIAFIILNGPRGGSAEGIVVQADLYPTLLHATGRGDYSWPGVGRNLFDPDAPEISGDTGRRISDLIVRGGYFR